MNTDMKAGSEETFGARFLETIVGTEYGCGCNDPVDPWTGVIRFDNGYDLERFIELML